MKSNFFKELEFYKKDSIPDGIFKSLEKFINDPKVKSVSFLPVKNMKRKCIEVSQISLNSHVILTRRSE